MSEHNNTPKQTIYMRYFVYILGCFTCYLAGMYVQSISRSSLPFRIEYPPLVSQTNVYIPHNLQKNITNNIVSKSADNQSVGQYVASKNGSKYYPVNCKSASRIKPENQIFFTTPSDAEQAGYSFSDQCSPVN